VVIAEDNDCRDKTEAKPLNGWLKMHAVIDNLIEIDKLYGMRKAFLSSGIDPGDPAAANRGVR
jgi:hypothetical protein